MEMFEFVAVKLWAEYGQSDPHIRGRVRHSKVRLRDGQIVRESDIEIIPAGKNVDWRIAKALASSDSDRPPYLWPEDEREKPPGQLHIFSHMGLVLWVDPIPFLDAFRSLQQGRFVCIQGGCQSHDFDSDGGDFTIPEKGPIGRGMGAIVDSIDFIWAPCYGCP